MSIIKLRKLIAILNNEKGASAVEFALLLPILLMLVFGIIQFGFIFFHYISITHAAREGARWASLENQGGTVVTPGTTRYVVRQAAPGLDLTDLQITISPENPTIDDANKPVTVTVKYDSPIIVPFVITSTNKVSLQSSATQKVE